MEIWFKQFHHSVTPIPKPMKKILVFLMTLIMMAGLGNMKAGASSVSSTKEATAASASAAKVNDEESAKLVARLHEIKDMDKSKLTSQDKRALRKEVLGIKKQLKEKEG